MKSNENARYLISLEEFKRINKSAFISGVLAIILGMFGVHRFYLKRKLTGSAFFIISMISINFGTASIASILMLVSITEGIVYIVRGVSLLKNKSLKEDGDLIAEENNKRNIVTEDSNLEIIEVTNIKPMNIKKNNDISNDFRDNWIEQLELPYERSVMSLEQVSNETIKFYEKLCDFIDKELKINNSSLSKEVNRLRKIGSYDNNILYTIYCISEGHVTKVYSGNNRYYDYNPSYRILEKHLGYSLKTKVFNKAIDLEESVEHPNKEVLLYFNLTEGGLPITWWDKDGSFRNSRVFSKEENNIMNSTPVRDTKVWEIYEVKSKIIELYLKIWDIVSSGLDKDLKWKVKSRDIVTKVVKGRYSYFSDFESSDILSSLLKVSENVIREIMPNTQILNIDKEKDIIKKVLPSRIVSDIDDIIIKYKENINKEEIENIVKVMIKMEPNNWRLKVREILIAESDKKVEILIDYEGDKNIIKIAKEVIKNIEDEDLLLLCLYIIEREENLSQKNTKLLNSIIFYKNINIYKNIVESKSGLSLDLLNCLVKVKSPIRKKIELDMDKVRESKEELYETIEIVKEYIGDDKEDEIVNEIDIEKADVEEEHSDKLILKYKDFLKLILEEGELEVERVKKISLDKGYLLNAFISNVNKEVYEFIQDQAVIVEENYVKIDEFYIDVIEELIKDEK